MALLTPPCVPHARRMAGLAVLLVAVLGTMAVLALAASEAGASPDPPTNGDWTIGSGEDVVKTSEALTVRGNLTVRSGGRLTLTDCDLRLDMPRSGVHRVRVETGAELVLDGGTTVDSTDVDMYYNITILGRATIGPATIRRLDGTPAPTPLTDPPGGLLLRSSDIRLHNTTVELSRGFAIAVDPPGLLTSVSPLIEDCVVRGNGGGIYCEGLILASGNPLVRNTRFYANTNGEALVIAAAPRFEGCTFGQLLSVSLMGVSAAALAEPVLAGCTFQYLGAGVVSLMASPDVNGCAVSLCAVGLAVIGGDPVVRGTTFANCPMSIMLNSTTATVADCSVTGLATVGHAISVDAGAPTLRNVTVDLDLIGGAISISNSSTALVDGCDLSGSGAADTVVVDGSAPTIRDCKVQQGLNGISLTWSAATLSGNDVVGNSGWGIVASHIAPSMSGNTYGTGGIANRDGRFLQLYQLTVGIEMSEGGPAEGASLRIVDALGGEVSSTVADAAGLALDELLREHSVDNMGDRHDNVPYSLEARLDDRINTTSFSFDASDGQVLIVLWPNLPPTARVLFPMAGAELNAWDHRGGIPLEGAGDDPEGDALSITWTLDGTIVEGADGWCATVRPLPGQHTVLLAVDDGHGHVAQASVAFNVTSVPPPSNGVDITAPPDGSIFASGEAVNLTAEVHVEEDPYAPGKSALTVTWTSDLTGLLGSGDRISLSRLPHGTHVITAEVAPTRTEWVDATYSDTVTIVIRPPPPMAVAVIASPPDDFETREDLCVTLSASGSHVTVWEDVEFVTVLAWTSSIDGPLGRGEELNVTGLSVGVHRITLELTTEPHIASANASITVVVLPAPPPNNPPVAMASLASEGRLYVNDTVNFTANGSYDPEGEVLLYSWDFGDGNTSTGLRASHAYAHAGMYNVTLSVSDDGSSTNVTLSVLIEEREVPPTPPPDGDGDGDGHAQTGDDAWGWGILILLVAAVAALAVLASRRRRGDA